MQPRGGAPNRSELIFLTALLALPIVVILFKKALTRNNMKQIKTTENNLEMLPAELIFQILSYLKLADFLNFAHASNWTRDMASKNNLSIKTRIDNKHAVIKGSYRLICEFLKAYPEKKRRLEVLKTLNIDPVVRKNEEEKIQNELNPKSSELSVSYQPINAGPTVYLTGNTNIALGQPRTVTMSGNGNFIFGQQRTVTMSGNTNQIFGFRF